MNELKSWQSALFILGGLLMVVSIGFFVFSNNLRAPASWGFLAGSILYASMQALQSYEGSSIVIKRLRRIMLVSDVLFVVAGLLMVEQTHNYLLPLFNNHLENGLNAYLLYIMNKWVVVLLVAGILQIYSTHRISNELAKEAKKM